MNTKESDESLMARLQGGDRSAYELIYRRWSSPVMTFLLRRTGSRAQAEDALQETFLKVFKYSKSYMPSKPFPPWLFRIAAHAGHDAYEPATECFKLEGSYESNPELRDKVVRALHHLKAMDRRVILLTVQGFNATEIGEILDQRPGTVRMQLTRVRRRLQGLLENSNV